MINGQTNSGSVSLGRLKDKLLVVVVCGGVSVWLLGKCVVVNSEKRGMVASVLNFVNSFRVINNFILFK